MSQRWALSHHKDEPYSVRLSRVPRWAVAIEAAGELLDGTILRHRWCNAPEWTFRVPLWPGRDKDGDPERSLGGAMFSSFQWITLISHRNETLSYIIPITREQAEAIDAEVVAEWGDLFDLKEES